MGSSLELAGQPGLTESVSLRLSGRPCLKKDKVDSDRGSHLMSASGLSMQAHMSAHMPACVHTHANKDKFIHLSLPLTHGAHQGLLSVFLNQASKVQPKNLFASKVI